MSQNSDDYNKALFEKIKVKCPWCGTKQTTSLFNNECFYCKNYFFAVQIKKIRE